MHGNSGNLPCKIPTKAPWEKQDLSYWVLGMEVEETCHQNVCTHLLSAVVFFNLLRPRGGGFNLENWLHLAKEPWTAQNSNHMSWGIFSRQSQIKATWFSGLESSPWKSQSISLNILLNPRLHHCAILSQILLLEIAIRQVFLQEPSVLVISKWVNPNWNSFQNLLFLSSSSSVNLQIT